MGSVSEVRYLLGLGRRLALLPAGTSERLEASYVELNRGLQKLLNALAAEP